MRPFEIFKKTDPNYRKFHNTLRICCAFSTAIVVPTLAGMNEVQQHKKIIYSSGKMQQRNQGEKFLLTRSTYTLLIHRP
jgi:hypothetical protein